MDRNTAFLAARASSFAVALRKESVDRNEPTAPRDNEDNVSLSARRAWIEIPAGCWRDSRRAVALRKESVDRNCPTCQWRRSVKVALRKESVDRNLNAVQVIVIIVSRSPQGERG